MKFLNNTKNNNKPKEINRNLKAAERFECICSNAVVIIAFIIFAYITVVSLFTTSIFDNSEYSRYLNEYVISKKDSLFLNILVLGGFTAILLGLRKYADVFKKTKSYILYGGIAIYVLVLGFWWIFSVKCIPASDSGALYNTISRVVNGDYSSMQSSYDYSGDYFGGVSYFIFYPFQLGFIFIGEIISNIFPLGSSMNLQICNVLAVAGLYIALIKISEKLFNNKAVSFILTFLLAGMLQPIMMSTFVYGNLFGACSVAWTIFFVIKYMQENKKLLLIPMSILMAISVLCKYNNLIFLVAIIIVLLIHTISAKRLLNLAVIALLCVATFGSSALVQVMYEKRSGMDFGKGVPQSAFLNMGISECNSAPGWFNYRTIAIFKENDTDTEKTNIAAKKEIQEKLEKFKSNPGYTWDFFSEKVLSQWNEPTYECIWVSHVRSHDGEIGSLAKSVYEGNTGKFLQSYMNFYQEFIFILFCIGSIALLIKKKRKLPDILIMTGIVGGFLYHLLFEGKSQYVLTYFIFMSIYAAYGLYVVLKPHNKKESKKNNDKKRLTDKILNMAQKIEDKTTPTAQKDDK